MKSTRDLLIALAAACALGTSIGCYTMLKHPRIKIDDKASRADEYYYDDESISFANDCASCHSPGSLQVHHPAVPPPRRLVSPTWDYYYDNPWWIQYYTSGNSNADAGTTEEEQKKRPFDRRHQSRPEEPAATPSSAATTPSAPTPVPATVAKPADSGAPASTPPKTENTNKREERDSGKKQSGERRTRKP
jgi:hypothetical protein